MPPKKHEVQIVIEVPDQPPQIEGNPALVDKLLAAVLTHPNDVAATVAGCLKLDDYLFNLQHGVIVDLWVETIIACAKHGLRANKTLAVIELVETLRSSIVETQSDHDAKIMLRNFFARHAGLAVKEKEQRMVLLSQLGLGPQGASTSPSSLTGGNVNFLLSNAGPSSSPTGVPLGSSTNPSIPLGSGNSTITANATNVSGAASTFGTIAGSSSFPASTTAGAISSTTITTSSEAFLTSLGLTLPPLLGPDGKAVMPTGTAMMMCDHSLGAGHPWGVIGAAGVNGAVGQPSTSTNGSGPTATAGAGVGSDVASGSPGAGGANASSAASPGKGKGVATKKKGVEEPPPPPKLCFDAGLYFLDANDMKNIAPFITRGIIQHWRLYATVGAFARTELFVPSASTVSDAVLEPVTCSFVVGIQTPMPSHHLGRALTLEDHTKKHADEAAKAAAERAALEAKEEAQIASERAALEAAAARRKAAEEEERASMLYLKKATAERAVDQLTSSIQTELSERQRRIATRIQKLEDALRLATGA